MQKPESYLLKRGAESSPFDSGGPSTTLTVADAVPFVVKKEVMKGKGSPGRVRCCLFCIYIRVIWTFRPQIVTIGSFRLFDTSTQTTEDLCIAF